MSLIVLCPSRGRPEKAAEAYQSFLETRKNPGTEMRFVVDGDDPTQQRYWDLNLPVEPGAVGGMGPALNRAAKSVLSIDGPVVDILGFTGDDHFFRTQGWDVEIEDVLTENGGGFAFGNDLARNDIPTQVFISSKIVMALGWMALPSATHLYFDNTWRVLGEGADCLYYLPDVVIEHMHPFAGKGVMDEGYLRVNAQSMYDHDQAVFNAWYHGQRTADIETVRGALG